MENTHYDNNHERSFSSDGTEFLDIPLPEKPARAIEIQNLDISPAVAALLFSRVENAGMSIAAINSLYDLNKRDLFFNCSINFRKKYTTWNSDENEVNFEENSSSEWDTDTPRVENRWSTSEEESSFYRDDPAAHTSRKKDFLCSACGYY